MTTADDRIRVLALVPALYDTAPGQRFRMEQWAPYLCERGIDVEFRAFECEELHDTIYRPGGAAKKARLIGRAIGRRIGQVRSASRHDVAYVFREAALVGPALFERWIRHLGVPIVFDFDDAVFERYVSPSNGCVSLIKCPGKIRTICRIASHVMAGNPYLESYARQVNAHVTMVPTTIETSVYTVGAPRPAADVPVVGWSGSYSTVQHLDGLRTALVTLAGARGFRLRVIGTPRLDLPGVDVEASAWRAATEVEDLRAIDIGVMPLPDDRWSRGKCGLKALQYMALGIPVVCSPVGVNRDIIQHGQNGLLAATDEEWVGCLTSLLESAELRTRLGLAGRATVEQRYSAQVQAPVVHDILARAASGAASRVAPPRRPERVV
jgi:glycosyltransferase involved in cell wall biosynthesis